jgi:catechol 2,3-dioxygenase-like lactoylglutathione lyase family enzyme
VIDHVKVAVSDFQRSKSFYERALEPLGYSLLMEFSGTVGGFGANRKPDFWIAQGEVGAPVHVAFAADRETADAFHAAALEAGGTDNGEPGPRPIYHETYYGAFVLDPDGHNVEVVCHN